MSIAVFFGTELHQMQALVMRNWILVILKYFFIPRSKHTQSLIKTSRLMLCREIISVCSEIHTKHINTVCGQNVELLNFKLVVHIVTTGL